MRVNFLINLRVLNLLESIIPPDRAIQHGLQQMFLNKKPTILAFSLIKKQIKRKFNTLLKGVIKKN